MRPQTGDGASRIVALHYTVLLYIDKFLCGPGTPNAFSEPIISAKKIHSATNNHYNQKENKLYININNIIITNGQYFIIFIIIV